MGIILGILAIILACIALLPYALEIWLWHYRKPRLLAEVHNKQASWDDTTHRADIRFSLSIRLNSGYPVYFRDLRLLLPWEAEPYRHPDTNETFQHEDYVQQRTEHLALRRALVLNVPHLPLNSHCGRMYMIAFHYPWEDYRSIVPDLFAEIENDEARLGFWAIFHHARRYLKTLPIKLDLSTNQMDQFIG